MHQSLGATSLFDSINSNIVVLGPSTLAGCSSFLNKN